MENAAILSVHFASACLICNDSLNRKMGIVAPFLAERIWGKLAFPVSLDSCRNCRFSFFNPRLDPEEELRLYSGYRSDEYQRARFAHEPWYTKTLNRNLGVDSRPVERRAEFIAKLIAGRSVESVLDFGGDMGQLPELLPISQKFVFDISGVPVRPGVSGFREMPKGPFDLITCSHVLEHVGDPVRVTAQMRQLAGAASLVYIEVPSEQPFAPLKRLAQAALVTALRPKTARQILRSGLLRVMHEHINYFTAQSLRTLAERSQLRVIDSGLYSPGGQPGQGRDALWCLAKV
jgi:hypothetical protein